MRFTLLLAIGLLAQPALAQQAPSVDGKAVLPGDFASVVPAGGKFDTPASVRSFIAVMFGKQTPDVKDFISEIASGAKVDLDLAGKPVRIAPLAGEPLAIAKLVANVPNLNTLWRQPGEPTLQLLEISRWGEPGRKRVVEFMSNKLYAAWSRSRVENAYSDWISEFGQANGAFDRIAEPALKTEAKLLLKAAMEQVFARCKTDGREPPPLFLYDLAFQAVGAPRPQ